MVIVGNFFAASRVVKRSAVTGLAFAMTAAFTLTGAGQALAGTASTQDMASSSIVALPTLAFDPCVGGPVDAVDVGPDFELVEVDPIDVGPDVEPGIDWVDFGPDFELVQIDWFDVGPEFHLFPWPTLELFDVGPDIEPGIDWFDFGPDFELVQMDWFDIGPDIEPGIDWVDVGPDFEPRPAVCL